VKKELNIPERVYLYSADIKSFDFKKARKYIRDNFGNIKVSEISLKDHPLKRNGLIFDYLATQRAWEESGASKLGGTCHILITDKLFATLDNDRRPHIRASIYSFCSVISTSGIVEGPAKPKEYYLYKQKYTSLGAWDINQPAVKKRFKGKFIDYKDSRSNDVLKGYIAQSLFFHITGEPFCKQRSCRLFNAHWQEDLIFSQVINKEFCREHRMILNKIKAGTRICRLKGGLQ